jgi:hypothetical protein
MLLLLPLLAAAFTATACATASPVAAAVTALDVPAGSGGWGASGDVFYLLGAVIAALCLASGIHDQNNGGSLIAGFLSRLIGVGFGIAFVVLLIWGINN